MEERKTQALELWTRKWQSLGETRRLRTDAVTLAPQNLSGLVDLVPVADLPPGPVLEPVVQKTHLQYHQSPPSGSKPALASKLHHPEQTPRSSFSYAM